MCKTTNSQHFEPKLETRLAIVLDLSCLTEKQFVSIFYTMHIFISLFIRSLQMSDSFYKSSFYLNYSTLLYDAGMCTEPECRRGIMPEFAGAVVKRNF